MAFNFYILFLKAGEESKEAEGLRVLVLYVAPEYVLWVGVDHIDYAKEFLVTCIVISTPLTHPKENSILVVLPVAQRP
jgi:hypothetical protein